MGYSVRSGAIYTAQKVVIYGPEGIGKTTLAQKFPDPVFIDTEESSKGYVVNRITRPDGGVAPTSWTMLLEMVAAVKNGQIPCKTLVIDSLDWSEALCISHVCEKNQKNGIEDFGYGKGYTYLEEEFGKLLNTLSEIVARGIHVVCTAHAAMRRVELPEETGAYDHWELKLEKKTAALVKEWADMVLFCNYKTIVIAGKNPMEKNKAAGGKRMMYATHTPWWDAKNRHSLPDEMEMDYHLIEPLFTLPETFMSSANPVPEAPAGEDARFPGPQDLKEPDIPPGFLEQPEEPPATPQAPQTTSAPPDGVPAALWDLMQADGISVEQVQYAVSIAGADGKGYYPIDTPIKNYDPRFIQGCLIAAWPSVKKYAMTYKGGK